MRLPIETLGKGDLVGITAKTLLIDRAKAMSRQIQAQGATVIMGGTHTTLVPEEVEGWADAIAVGEGYRTWPQIIRDFDNGHAPAALLRRGVGAARLGRGEPPGSRAEDGGRAPQLLDAVPGDHPGLPALLHLLHRDPGIGPEDAAAAGRKRWWRRSSAASCAASSSPTTTSG